MATTAPARNMYEIAFDYGLWWETAIGGSIFPDSPYLQISATGDLAAGNEYARAALKFSTSVPSWVTVGDITERHAILWMYGDCKASDQGGSLKIATINAAWDMSSTQAHMAAIATGAWSISMTPVPDRGQGWIAIPLLSGSTTLRNANGIMLKIATSILHCGAFRFMKDPEPTGRAYLAYNILDTVHGSATARLEADADALAALTKAGTVYSIAGNIIRSHILPDESDVPIVIGKGSSLAINSHSVQLPETWKLDRGNRGSLSMSRAVVDLLDYRGSLIEVSLTQRIAQKTASTIATQKGIIGSVNKTLIEQDTVIEDILKESLNMTPYYRDPVTGIESVNILSEPRMYALLLILINGGGIPWSRFRQADLVWLLRRFGIVWDNITENSAAMAAFTVASFAEEYGAQYGICLSRGVDDSIIIWHPAVYRPSMKVWSVNDKDINDIRYRKVSSIDKYDMVVINTDEIQWDTAMSRQIDGKDKKYSVTGLTGVFATREVCRYSLGRQLAQRFIADHEEYEFIAGAGAIPWEVGDKLKITSSRNNLSDTVFTIADIDGKGLGGKYKVFAIRWPDSPGLQSTWKNTDIKGIYRLEEWDTAAGTGVNQSHEGRAGNFTVTTINNLLHYDWRGPVANVDLTAPATFAPYGGGGSSTYYDLVDFVLAIFGRQDTDPNPGAQDQTYTRILMFRKSINNHAVICGIKRIPHNDGHGVDYYSTVDTRIFLGATDDYTADPIVWNHAGADYVETPPGFSTNTWGWNYGVAVQWHSDSARLWVDGVYIGEITAFDADIDICEFDTPVHAEHKVGCIRWLQKTGGWFSADRLIGRCGEDTYYP